MDCPRSLVIPIYEQSAIKRITTSDVLLYFRCRGFVCTFKNEVASLDKTIVLIPGICNTLVGTIRTETIEGCYSLLV